MFVVERHVLRGTDLVDEVIAHVVHSVRPHSVFLYQQTHHVDVAVVCAEVVRHRARLSGDVWVYLT